MLLLHLPWSSHHALLLVCFIKVAEKFQDSVSNREGCLVNVLFAYVLWIQVGSLVLELTAVRVRSAVFAVKLVSNNPNKNLVFHKNSVFVFLEGDIKLKSSVVGGPGVVALVALKLKKALLQPLHDKEVFVIPSLAVLREKSGEGLLVRPLDANPLEALVLAELSGHELVLNRQFAINVVLDLFDGRVSLVVGLSQRDLEPISNFEDVSVL